MIDHETTMIQVSNNLWNKHILINHVLLDLLYPILHLDKLELLREYLFNFYNETSYLSDQHW